MKSKRRTLYSDYSKENRKEVTRKIGGDDPRPVWLVITSPHHCDLAPGDRYE